MNIFSNFIRNKLVTFNDKDPAWMSPNLWNKINWKIVYIYKKYIKNGEINYHYLQLQNAISQVSVPIPRGKDDYHSQLAQKLKKAEVIPVQAQKHIGLFWKDFSMGKKYQLLYPSWSITSWNQTLKLQPTILAVSLLQNILPLLTTVLYLIHYIMFQQPGFPHFVSTRKSY